MKNLTVLLLCVLVIFGFSACQKEIDADLLTTPVINTNDSTDFKVRTYTQAVSSATLGNFSETFNLTYDSQGRILSLIDVADSTTKFIYAYSSGSYTLDLIDSGALSIHETFFLNNIPLIDSTSQYNADGDTTLEKNIYDGSNRLVRISDYDYTTAGGSQLTSVTDYTYDTNGNIAQETEGTDTTSYEYFDELNTVDVGTIYQPQDKKLVKTSTINSGGTTVTINHTYTFDNLHRVTSERQEYSTGDVVVNSYTY